MQALQYIELDVDHCSLVYGVSPCRASLAMAGDDAPQNVNFDGVAAYLTRGAGLTGAADSKLLTGSFWFRAMALPVSSPARVFSSSTAAAGSTIRTRISHLTTGQIAVIGVNAAGTTILDIRSSALELGRWYHVLFSVDLSNTGKRWLYVNDVSDLDVQTYTNDTMDLTMADWSVGAQPNGAQFYNGDLGELWIDFGGYLDFSVQSNRRLFISSAKQPVVLGLTGSVPTGSAPEVFLSGEVGSWYTNKGTGGGFTTHGALTATPSEVGRIKCFNTRVTCQDTANFTNAPVTLRFAVDSSFLPADIECTPSIKNIGFDPATISLGENLGQRATLTVTFEDHRHSDTGAGGDPYLTERDYYPNAYSRGTFFGKFRARQPYLIGRPLRWINGEVGDALADMETRHFIVDSFSGPTPAGQYTLVAKDVLKLADGSKALAPAANTGFLLADITDTAMTLTLSPAGVGNSEYPAGVFKANIGGKEIVTAYRDVTAGNDANTLFLCHADGADASAVFTDSSTSTLTITVDGGAQIDTAQSKFGGSSLLGDGTNDDIRTPALATWRFAGVDFTVECFARITSLATLRAVFAWYFNGNNYWHVFVNTNGSIAFKLVDNTVTTVGPMTSATGIIVVNTWHHIALSRTGTVWRLYVDGVSVANTTDASTIPALDAQIWFMSDQLSANTWLGWLDEMRISNVARYSGAGSFTPTIVPFQASTDALTITRAQAGTAASSHSAQDLVQEVLEYAAEDAADIIADLLENYAGGDPSYIPLTTWQGETGTYLNRVYTAVIPNPTSVNTLISELIQQAGLSMWWNDRDQSIGLLVLRGIVSDAVRLTEDNVMAGTLEITEQPDKRLSQVHVYFGQINPLTSLTDESNYRSKSITRDSDAEANYGSPAIKKIYSRWIPALGRTVADRLGTILLGRFKDPPRHFRLGLLRGSLDEIIMARGYRIEAWPIQDETGAATSAPVQVTRLKPSADIISIEADEVLFTSPDEDLSVRNIIIDANISNVDLRDAHDSLYPTPESGDVVVCTINDGVIVGSTSTTLWAFDVGTWPSGVDITLIINGRIQGAGGNAGKKVGGHHNGYDGGPALYTRQAIDLEIGTGEIFGGAGGGGWLAVFPIAGGGGGAGSIPGIGGDADVDGQAGTADAGGLGGINGSGHGGNGGGPGLAGETMSDVGGAAGNAIDGVSYVTVTVGPGDIRGGQVN